MRMPKLSIKQQRLALINFMRKKAELITIPDYFTYIDEKYLLKEASDEWIQEAFRSIHKALVLHKGMYLLTDDLICPWCVSNRNNCEICTYGKVHGKCNESRSTYRRLRVKNLWGFMDYEDQIPSLWLNSITQARIQTELVEKGD